MFNLVGTYASSMLGWNMRFMKPTVKNNRHHISLLTQVAYNTQEFTVPHIKNMNNKERAVPVPIISHKSNTGHIANVCIAKVLLYIVLVRVMEMAKNYIAKIVSQANLLMVI